ncbi:MAG: nucleoside triphosphate pyrophosphohydrolase [Acidimicrobiia bacterium]
MTRDVDHERGPTRAISIVGIGPAGLDHVVPEARALLSDTDVTVVLRTERHPGAELIASERDVITCDDLYESLPDFDDVYTQIADRVMELAAAGPVVFAVPGSAVVGERAAAMIVTRGRAAGIDVVVFPGLSFLDLAYVAVGVDPITDGAQVLDARDLPDPLPLHLPTFITQVDSTFRAADLSLALTRTVDPESPVTVLTDLGGDDQSVKAMSASDLMRIDGGPRTTVFLPATSSGLLGLIAINRVLRTECPWDKKQTHHTLLTHLIEEAYETADAIAALPLESPGGEIDFAAYADVEEELGDLLLQVVFHATLASEAGVFNVDEVAEGIRRKLVARHPHVFAGVAVADADEVLANWEELKNDEKQRESLMDDVPVGMPGVARAVKVQNRARSVGFDWSNTEQVIDVLRGEIDELVDAGADREAAAAELGDVLFSAINVSRHLDVDPEVALRASVDRFMKRFRSMERTFAERDLSMRGASDAELEAAWVAAKRSLS